MSLAQFGGVGTVVTGALYGPDVAVPYMMGVGAGALYLFLLGKKVDGFVFTQASFIFSTLVRNFFVLLLLFGFFGPGHFCDSFAG